MKILSIEQIRDADKYTIGNEPILSIDLMERAAEKCSAWLLKNYGKDFHYLFFCGNGNNGSDGLAIARQLSDAGCEMDVFVVKASSSDSKDFSTNLERLSRNKIPFKIISDTDEISFSPKNNPLIIDAIFGSGLSREPESIAAQLIDKLNAVNIPKISIDIPSGLFGDDNLKNSYTHVIRAAHTLTFQQPKISFLFAENFPFAGEFHVLDIGLDEKFIAEARTPFHFITHSFAKQFLKPRTKFSHKGTFGHALIVAGSMGKIGAAILSTRACLNSGVGLVTATVPKCGNYILQVAVPEAMVDASEGEDFISGRIAFGANKNSGFSAIGIGPGMGMEKETVQSLKLALNEYVGPLVMDADAINILAENKTWLAFLPKGTILTPHPGEFDRLTEKHKSGFERMKTQRELSVKNGIYIVLKGAHTSIACPDGSVFFNSSGNPGMATGGSGDVLTGIITSLRAQGYNPQSACILGVYAHGLAGDISASVHSQHGMTAGNIIENLGGAWRMLSADFAD